MYYISNLCVYKLFALLGDNAQGEIKKVHCANFPFLPGVAIYLT